MEKEVSFAEKKIPVQYSITNAIVKDITPDTDAFSTIITIETVDDGELTIRMPKELLDSKREDKKYDDDFFVIVDGEEVEFKEIRGDSIRELLIAFPKDAEEIEIIGTKMDEQYLDFSDEKNKENQNISEEPPEIIDVPSLGISWSSYGYPPNGQGTVVITNPDLESTQEEISIKVWSDSDKEGIIILGHKVQEDSNEFKGIVNFTTNEMSTESKLHVSEGDTITAEYSLNDNEGNPKTITATTMIPTFALPLERMEQFGIRVTDIYDNELAQPIPKGYPVLIRTDLENNLENDETFAYIVTIQKKEDGEIVEEINLGALQGKMVPGQKMSCSLSWTPNANGIYIASVFIWKSLDNPTAISPPSELEIIVNDWPAEGDTSSFKKEKSNEVDSKKDLSLESTDAVSGNTVIIPSGTSVPGCEETGRCFIPSTLVVKINDEVVWKNSDTESHTITSGTPDDGPDGKFDSGLMMPNATFTHKFTEKGVFAYHCMVHPWQNGVIIVEKEIS